MTSTLRTRRRGFRAFTIVELLVVIAIIGVLVGLILPALSGVQKRSRKTTELNNLKQLGHAWTLYGINNNDAALPGYLDSAVQMPPQAGVSRGWGVTYEYPDKTDIPIDSVNNLAGPWTWRLISYIDYAHEPIHGYREEDDEFSMLGVATNLAEAKAIAYEPAFGYNGYYVGGYWQMEDLNGLQTPRFRFNNARSIADPTVGHPGNQPVIVCTTIGKIQRSTEVIVFCTSSHFDTIGPQHRPPNDRAGSHLVTPPFLADAAQWWHYQDPSSGWSDQTVLQIESASADAPLGRYTGQPAIMYADGHVDTQSYGALVDMRLWIDSASFRNFRHTP